MAFSKRRAALLTSDAGRWALFVQPYDRRRRPEFVGCFDVETEACAAGFQSPIGRRFLVKAVLEQYPVISVPRVVRPISPPLPKPQPRLCLSPSTGRR